MEDFDKRRFARFEKDEALFHHCYDGYPYWQLLRFYACKAAFDNAVFTKSTTWSFRKALRFVSKGFRLTFCAVLGKLSLLTLKDSEVVCFHGVIQSDFFYKGWSLPENISRVFVRTSVPNTITKGLNDCVSPMWPYLVARIKHGLGKRLRKGSRDVKEYRFLQTLERKMSLEFGSSMTAEQMEDMIRRNKQVHLETKRFYERLFDKTNCRAIIVVCYYQELLYPVYELAKERDVIIIELQHGVIFNHQSYWFEDQSGTNIFVPDYFLAFGKGHIDGAKMLSSTYALPLGYPFQDEQIEELRGVQADDKLIVVYPEANELFEEVIIRLSDLASPKGYKIVIKLHPLQCNDYEALYPALSKDCNVTFSTDQSKGIYHWLSKAKHHVMVNTTVGLEAVRIPGIAVYIADFLHHEQLQLLLDYGVARTFKSAGELMSQIENPLVSENDELCGRLWTHDSARNFEDFFSELKKQDWPSPDNFRIGTENNDFTRFGKSANVTKGNPC